MKHLLEHCRSESQREKVELYAKYNSVRRVAKELGIAHQSVSDTLRTLKRRAAVAGVAPEADMTHQAAEGFNVKGVSTYYDEDGNVKGQWVKTQNQGASPEEVADVFNAALADFAPLPSPAPTTYDDDLLAVYPMGDPHIGLLSWHEETGEDYDLDIATKDLRKAAQCLVDRSPNTKTAIILNLGDFFHSDNMDNRTARSGHSLDVDGRWHKILRTGIDLMCEIVHAALDKHEKVIVKNIIGNHDDHSSVFLGLAMDKYFHNEPRVEVDHGPSKFWYYQFGNVLIGSCHGDTAKPDKLPQIMAADKFKEWGETEYRYWYTGHIHSRNAMEFAGCTWESFRTLAAKDAWHSAMGYRSGRDMSCILIHKEFGEVGRNTASIKMVRST